mmetsp:Transcript_9351/g.22512  ORF Transcript_9351/g.22512 Transcript_9351/m.22512 type:complete len:304 (+) Transcript_9351:1060-1971(+)
MKPAAALPLSSLCPSACRNEIMTIPATSRLAVHASIIPLARTLVGRTSEASSQATGPSATLKKVMKPARPITLAAALPRKKPTAVARWESATPAQDSSMSGLRPAIRSSRAAASRTITIFQAVRARYTERTASADRPTLSARMMGVNTTTASTPLACWAAPAPTTTSSIRREPGEGRRIRSPQEDLPAARSSSRARCRSAMVASTSAWSPRQSFCMTFSASTGRPFSTSQRGVSGSTVKDSTMMHVGATAPRPSSRRHDMSGSETYSPRSQLMKEPAMMPKLMLSSAALTSMPRRWGGETSLM